MSNTRMACRLYAPVRRRNLTEDSGSRQENFRPAGVESASKGVIAWRKGVAMSEIVLGLTVAFTMAEFVEIQQLAVEDLSKRFALAPSCQLSLTASAAAT